MFKLHRLEITGFKSFADYTEILFTGDGITAVVGPNGCGKSNVADAIAWVLGEQRVKHLRGGEMKDVIFQGSKSRSPDTRSRQSFTDMLITASCREQRSPGRRSTTSRCRCWSSVSSWGSRIATRSRPMRMLPRNCWVVT